MNGKLADIELFARIDENKLDQIETLFSTRHYQQNAVVIHHGEQVNGLYLVLDGEVDIVIPGFDGVIATLDKGTSFGEMSLFDLNDVASATVTVSTKSAELFYCPRESLASALAQDQSLAAGFYHGSALMMAHRLRGTNEKISGEIGKSIQMASELIEEVASTGMLESTQNEIQAAGSSIVSGMTGILKRLLAMKQTGEPVPHQDISHLADITKDLYYSEFQVFDRVYQQLQLLGQHLENVKRILSEQEVLEITGDGSLLD